MKRLICMILSAVFAVASLAVNAAEVNKEWISLDFENDATGSEPASYPGEGATPNGAKRVVVSENGNNVFNFYNPTSSNMVNYCKVSTSVPSEVFFEFDLKIDEYLNEKPLLAIDCQVGSGTGTRLCIYFEKDVVYTSKGFTDGIYLRSCVHEPNAWYRYLIHYKNIGTSNAYGVLYRKALDAEGAEYELMGQTNATNSAGSGALNFRIYGNGMDCSLDNMRVWNGSFSQGGEFLMDSEVIGSTDCVTSGILTANMKVTGGEMVTEIEDDITREVGKTVTAWLVVHDAEGRMVDCEIIPDARLKVGKQELSLSVDTGDYAETLNGGYVGMYIWNDIVSARSLVEPIVLQ